MQRRFAPLGIVKAYDDRIAALEGGSPLQNIVEDLTPQLGGPLDMNGQYVSTSLQVQNTAPKFSWYETDGAADGKLWDAVAEAGILRFRSRTDANGTGTDWLQVIRSGNTVTNIALGGNATLDINVDDFIDLDDTSSTVGIRLKTGGTQRGYLYADADGIGILNDAGGWSLRHNHADDSVDVIEHLTAAKGFVVENTSSTSQYGISLYSATTATSPTYGIMFTGTAAEGNHAFNTGDWNTYFTMNNGSGRGWTFRDMTTPTNVASISNTGQLTADGLWRSASGNDVSWDSRLVQGIRPGGSSSYYSTTATETGYLKIQLPTSISNAMLGFEVHGYNYDTTDTHWGVRVSNYAQSAGAWWTNFGFDIIYGNPPFDVCRFYADASNNHWVLLGESTTDWNYPQIEIRNVIAGFTGGEGAAGDWNLSISNSTTGLTLKRGPTYAGAVLKFSGQSGYNLGGHVTVQSGGSPSGGQNGDIYLIY